MERRRAEGPAGPALDSGRASPEPPPGTLQMAEERRYALEAFFGPARANMTQYTPHAWRLRMRVVETGPGMAVLSLPYHEELIGDGSR